MIPDGVACGAEVKAVFLIEFGAQGVGGAEERGGDVEVAEGAGLAGAVGGDEGVGLALLGEEELAGGAGLDRKVEDAAGGEVLVDGAGEGGEVLSDAGRGMVGGGIVVAGVKDDEAGAQGQDEARGEEGGIFDEGAAKAAIGKRQAGKAVGQVPEADARTAGENDAPRGGRAGLVLGFDLGDFLFPRGVVERRGRLALGGEVKQGEKNPEQGAQGKRGWHGGTVGWRED